jgi:rhodanese-related sulfurtransferase
MDFGARARRDRLIVGVLDISYRERRKMPTTISREELKAKLDAGEKFFLVNVLSPGAFRREHIPGSMNVPVSQVERRARELWNVDDEIVVYCSNSACEASPMAAASLDSLGYRHVADYEGGIEDWKEAGYPVESFEEREGKSVA